MVVDIGHGLASDTFLTYSLSKCSAEFLYLLKKILECSTNNHLAYLINYDWFKVTEFEQEKRFEGNLI